MKLRELFTTKVTDILTDIDGNVYKTIKIGTQWWMAENLKVTRYRNFDPIPNITDNKQWEELTIGAYCWFDNDILKKHTCGALYNWFAINDSRSIAPVGWHIPTLHDWNILANFLGGNSIAGGKMKVGGTDHWHSPNIGASNSSKFNGFPCGYRGANGGFGSFGYAANIWSSSQASPVSAWDRCLLFNFNELCQGDNNMAYGFSVRCLRD